MRTRAFAYKAGYEMFTFVLLYTMSWIPILCGMKGAIRGQTIRTLPAFTLQDSIILFFFLGYEMSVYVIGPLRSPMLWSCFPCVRVVALKACHYPTCSCGRCYVYHMVGECQDLCQDQSSSCGSYLCPRLLLSLWLWNWKNRPIEIFEIRPLGSLPYVCST